MVAFIKVKRWTCPSCTEVVDTEDINERPVCVHKTVLWDAKGPFVHVEVIPMQFVEERWS